MTPAARITINGVNKPDLLARLVSMTLTDEAGVKADTLEIELDARDGVTAPRVGTEMKIYLGYAPTPTYRGRYRVVSWEKEGPPAVLRVHATAADLTDEIKARKMRSWHATTVGAIVKAIAAQHGLTAVVAPSVSADVVPHIDQQTESDMSFLTRLAKRHGAIFKVGSGRLLFGPKGSKALADGTPKTQVALKPADLSHWSLKYQARGNYKSVKTTYVDATTGKHVTVTAGTGKPAHRDPRRYGSKAAAQAAAKAGLGDLMRSRLEADIEGAGNPALYPDGLIALSGFDPDADGEYLAKTVTHTFSGDGYKTSVHMEVLAGNVAGTEDDGS